MSGQSGPAIGIDSFSYHRFFGEIGEWEDPSPVRWSTRDFLDRAAALGADVVSLQTVYLEELSTSGMRALRVDLERRRLDVVLAWGHRAGLQSGESAEAFEDALACLDLAVEVGAGLVRIVCGDQFSGATPAPERRRRLMPMLDGLVVAAARRSLDLAVENHADFTMAELVALVDAVGAPNLGICLDIGNAARVGDDPIAAARLAAPHVRMIQVRDLAIQPDSLGKPWAWWPSVPPGRGDLDVATALRAVPSGPAMRGWFVEMANMHTGFADEDAAVAESIRFLRALAG